MGVRKCRYSTPSPGPFLAISMASIRSIREGVFPEQGIIQMIYMVIERVAILERLMRNLASAGRMNQVLIVLAVLIGQVGAALAQDGDVSSSPEGMSMLVLFLGIAGIIGVFVIRWSQSTGDDDEGA